MYQRIPQNKSVLIALHDSQMCHISFTQLRDSNITVWLKNLKTSIKQKKNPIWILYIKTDMLMYFTSVQIYNPDLHYLMSRRLSSPLHITCLAPANNLAIFMYSGVLVSLLCPSPCLCSVEGVLKKSWSSRCRACYDRFITPPFALD